MQILRTELVRAQALRSGAQDLRARDALDGVILALGWAIEGQGANPSDLAAIYRTHPLDHDGDGKAGGSRKGRLATARKGR